MKVETAIVDRRDMQFSYLDGDMYVFMDTSNWEQTSLTEEVVGEAKDFMVEGQDVVIAFHEGNALFVERSPPWCSRSSSPSPACRATAPAAAPSPRA